MGTYLLAAVLGAFGQLCFKFVGTSDVTGIDALVLNGWLWLAVISYFGIMGLFLIGLRWWQEMSVLYPIYGSTFVFGLLFSSLFLNERPGVTAAIGTAFIILGIVLLSRSKDVK